jgi:outer membrane protein assembly factor BamB
MRLGILAVAAVLGLTIGPAAARAADQTTPTRVDAQHSNAVPDSALRPPLRLRWQAKLGELVSNVVIAGGRVFYVRHPGTEPHITALRASDGALLWTRTWAARTLGSNGLAYDGGRLFFVRDHSAGYPGDVHVEAIDPATGATIWNRNISSEYGAGSHPTVADGELYFVENSGSSTLYSLRQSDGSDRWPPRDLSSGSGSTPTLDAANVYVSLSGPQTFAFDRATGAERWHYAPCCNGGGGTTTMVYGRRLFAEGGLIHDIGNGLVVGNWSAMGVPTWSGSLGVAHSYNAWDELRGFGPSYETTRWRFRLPDADLSPSLIAGPYVYASTINFAPWQLMALRLNDGARVWCQLITEQPPGTQSNSPPQPVAAGHGLLLVSNGYGLAAYGSGGAPSDCASSAQPPPQPSPQPSLTLTASRRSLRLGQRTRLGVRLSGMADLSGRTIAIDVDRWPFDGRYRRAAVAGTGRDGTAALRYAPRRNVRLRARLVGRPRLISRPVAVYTDFRITVRKHDAGGRRPQLRLTIEAPRHAGVLRRRVVGYLARGAKPWRRVADGRWRRDARTARATLRYPRGRLRRGDRWLVCTRERKPDAFGRPKRIDRLCGRRTLPR